jgi:hypothetical protein
MELYNQLITIMIVIIIFIIYKIIVEYNKGGMSRAIILDTIVFSLLIILYPFYLIYDYIIDSFNSFFYKKNNNEENEIEKVNEEKVIEKVMKKKGNKKKKKIM